MALGEGTPTLGAAKKEIIGDVYMEDPEGRGMGVILWLHGDHLGEVEGHGLPGSGPALPKPEAVWLWGQGPGP